MVNVCSLTIQHLFFLSSSLLSNSSLEIQPLSAHEFGKVDLTPTSRMVLSGLSQAVHFISIGHSDFFLRLHTWPEAMQQNKSQDSCLEFCDKYTHLQAMFTLSYYIPPPAPSTFNNFS